MLPANCMVCRTSVPSIGPTPSYERVAGGVVCMLCLETCDARTLERLKRGEMLTEWIADAYEATMRASTPGQPLHDAKRDPSAGVRYGDPRSLVKAIAELDFAAEAAIRNPRAAFNADGFERVRSLCRRALEMIDLLEATRASIKALAGFREELRASLLEADAGLEAELPTALADIERALGPLEAAP